MAKATTTTISKTIEITMKIIMDMTTGEVTTTVDTEQLKSRMAGIQSSMKDGNMERAVLQFLYGIDSIG